MPQQLWQVPDTPLFKMAELLDKIEETQQKEEQNESSRSQTSLDENNK